MDRITNSHYVDFLKGKMIDTIPRQDLQIILDNIDHRYLDMAKSLFFLCWSTGARPNEILNLVSEDITKKGSLVKIQLPPSKRGKPRTILLPYEDELVKEMWAYVSSCPPSLLLFHRFRSKRIRKLDDKEYIIITDKIYYWFKKWTGTLWEDGVPPYYLRHNRLSIAAEELSLEELRQLKGARSYKSVLPYIHQTKKQAIKISKELLK